jgi:hypothetical protein
MKTIRLIIGMILIMLLTACSEKADVTESIADTSPTIYVVPHIANYPFVGEAFEVVDDALKYELLEIITTSLVWPAAEAEISKLITRSLHIQPSVFMIGDTRYSFERIEPLLVVETEGRREHYILTDEDFERVHEIFFELTK